jgi:hypothetical protein
VTYAADENGAVEKYTGDWVEGKMHGLGRYSYSDGAVYEGEAPAAASPVRDPRG